MTSVQFISVTQSCLTLCDPMNRSTPGLPVHHQLLEFTQTHISSSVVPFSSCRQSFPASGSFPMSQLLVSHGQSTGASTSVLPGINPGKNHFGHLKKTMRFSSPGPSPAWSPAALCTVNALLGTLPARQPEKARHCRISRWL